MILLILCLLSVIATAITYVIEREDEEKERTWICTLRILFAAVSFAFLLLFLTWSIFFNEKAVQRDHTVRDTEPWDYPEEVYIEGIPTIEKKKFPPKSKPEFPDVYRKKTIYHPISVCNLPYDSIIWIKLHDQNDPKRTKTTYRFAMTNYNNRIIVEADSVQVKFVNDKRPYVQEIRKWYIKDYPILGRQPKLHSINYIISLPHNISWLEFRQKEE